MLDLREIHLLLIFIIEVVFADLSPIHARVGYYPHINMKTCGLTNPKAESRDVPQSKIIAGELAPEGESPWLVSIHVFDGRARESSFLGAGSLINPMWILTVRHILIKPVPIAPEYIKVFFGSNLKYSFNISVDVLDYYLHRTDDLALIRLKRSVFPVHNGRRYLINGICLPKEKILNTEHEDAFVAGWGWTDQDDSIETIALRHTHLLIDPYDDCMAFYTIGHLCGTETVHMTCYGDSGSPLVQFDGNRAVAVGAVEGGQNWVDLKLCGPGYLYFPRISYFIDWIQDVIERNSMPQTAHTVQNESNISGNSSSSLVFNSILVIKCLAFVVIIYNSYNI